MENTIKHLRTFFRASNIVLEIASKALGQPPVISPMHKLYQLALEEIEKETPDLEKIDSLLSEIGKQTEK